MIVSLSRNLWRLSAGKKTNLIIHVFLDILQRCCKLIALSTLGMPGYVNPKSHYQLVENFCVYSIKDLATRVGTPFKATPTPIFFNQLLTSMNLYQHEKNLAVSSFSSRDIVDLKFLQSDWSRAFWTISPEPEFLQIWDLPKHTAINTSFNYRPNWEKKL